MTAANNLGLTDAAPPRVTIHPDTRRRTIQLDNMTYRPVVQQPSASARPEWAYHFSRRRKCKKSNLQITNLLCAGET
jgi:hypothetical protein